MIELIQCVLGWTGLALVNKGDGMIYYFRDKE